MAAPPSLLEIVKTMKNSTAAGCEGIPEILKVVVPDFLSLAMSFSSKCGESNVKFKDTGAGLGHSEGWDVR